MSTEKPEVKRSHAERLKETMRKMAEREQWRDQTLRSIKILRKGDTHGRKSDR